MQRRSRKRGAQKKYAAQVRHTGKIRYGYFLRIISHAIAATSIIMLQMTTAEIISAERSRGDIAAAAKRQVIRSDIKTEKDDVSVLHYIILALGADEPCLLCGVIAAALHKSVKGYHFGAYKAAFEIGVDFPRCLRSLCAFGNGPGAYLLRPGGKKADKSKQGVAGFDQAVKTGFL